MLRGLLLLAVIWTARAQSVPDWQTKAGGKMAFEVASVKLGQPDAFRSPSFPLDTGDAYRTTGGRFSAVSPLSVYIRFAYKLSLTQEQTQAMLAGLPKWVATDRFDIEARAPGSPTKDQMRLMMQSLLAERFGFVAHFENRDMPIFNLKLIRPGVTGPRLRAHSDGPPCDAPVGNGVFPEICDVYAMTLNRDGTRRSGSRNTTMALLAGALPTFTHLGRPVVDQTGLTGRVDFVLEWEPDPSGPLTPAGGLPPAPEGATFLQALREQLGLRLEATRGTVETLVIDHVERPSEN